MMAEQLDYDDVLQRCQRWSGSVAELKELGIIIQNVFNADQDDFVEAFCLALFEHDLPALYKAKFYAYLSTHPDYDETSYLHVAENWIQTAKEQSAALGWIPDEVEQWAEIIDKQKAEPADLSLEGLTLGGMDGTLDGAGDAPGRVHGKGKAPAHVHDVDNCKMCQRMKYGDDAALLERVPATRDEEAQATLAAATQKATQKYDKWKVDDAEKQKLRQQAARIPKSQRVKHSVRSHQDGTGTKGTLRKALIPKKSISNFDLFRQQQQEQAEEDKKEEGID